MTSLTSFKLLSFDVYGTLIDWESGLVKALHDTLPISTSTFSGEHLLKVYYQHEAAQQMKTPGMAYSDILSTIHPLIAASLNLPTPSAEDSKNFSDSIGSWPAFPDTVDALKRLHKHYKLVVLSNIDRKSFSATNAGPLQGFPFDAILTAQDIGSYKPNLNNFNYMLREVDAKLRIKKEEVLQTAQSQFHDHQPAKKMGISSVWIDRSGTAIGNVNGEDVIYDWRFETLGEMAEALEKELAGSK